MNRSVDTIGENAALREARFETGRPLVFDLTTSAMWAGPPVGIVRVERELARYALTLEDRPISFSFFDKRRRRFMEIDWALVPKILAGQLVIDAGQVPEFQGSLLRRPRRHLVRVAAHIANEGKGRLTRSLGRSAFRALAKKGERGLLRGKKQAKGAFEQMGIDQACPRQLPLDKITIVSGGLDWQQKDIHSIYEAKKKADFQYAAICYDLIAWKFPHLTTPKYSEFLSEYFGELMWTADKLMCISQCSARDLEEFTAANLTRRPVLGVFPLGGEVSASTAEAVLPGGLEEGRFVLYVSTIEARKNHRLLYRTWERMLATNQTRGVKLVFVGHKGWLTNDLVSEMRRNPAVKNQIVVMNGLSDATLAKLYRSCLFTVYPSFYEGFGLPVVESLGYGKICLASEASSIPELIGNMLPMFDPFNEDAWYKAICRLVDDAEYRSTLENRIRDDYRVVTWSDSARLFFNGL